MAAVKRTGSTKPKKTKVSVSREELARQKEVLGERLKIVYDQVMSFCRGAPPQRGY